MVRLPLEILDKIVEYGLHVNVNIAFTCATAYSVFLRLRQRYFAQLKASTSRFDWSVPLDPPALRRGSFPPATPHTALFSRVSDLLAAGDDTFRLFVTDSTVLAVLRLLASLPPLPASLGRLLSSLSRRTPALDGRRLDLLRRALCGGFLANPRIPASWLRRHRRYLFYGAEFESRSLTLLSAFRQQQERRFFLFRERSAVVRRLARFETRMRRALDVPGDSLTWGDGTWALPPPPHPLPPRAIEALAASAAAGLTPAKWALLRRLRRDLRVFRFLASHVAPGVPIPAPGFRSTELLKEHVLRCARAGGNEALTAALRGRDGGAHAALLASAVRGDLAQFRDAEAALAARGAAEAALPEAVLLAASSGCADIVRAKFHEAMVAVARTTATGDGVGRFLLTLRALLARNGHLEILAMLH